jgi:hypothetical protein
MVTAKCPGRNGYTPRLYHGLLRQMRNTLMLCCSCVITAGSCGREGVSDVLKRGGSEPAGNVDGTQRRW